MLCKGEGKTTREEEEEEEVTLFINHHILDAHMNVDKA